MCSMPSPASARRSTAGVPLIGFSGSPWTLACYMVEGGGSDDYRQVKTLMYERPDLMHRILAVNADAVAAYLNAQIEAGAQAVMVFDSWGGVLADGAFQRFSLAYTQRVLKQLKKEHDGQRIPRIVFTKGGGLWLEEIAASDTDAVGVDWTVNLGQARARVGEQRRPAGQSRSQRAVCRSASRFVLKSHARLKASGRHATPMAAIAAMCSISAMASASSRRRKACPFWSMRCMNTHAASASRELSAVTGRTSARSGKQLGKTPKSNTCT